MRIRRHGACAHAPLLAHSRVHVRACACRRLGLWASLFHVQRLLPSVLLLRRHVRGGGQLPALGRAQARPSTRGMGRVRFRPMSRRAGCTPLPAPPLPLPSLRPAPHLEGWPKGFRSLVLHGLGGGRFLIHTAYSCSESTVLFSFVLAVPVLPEYVGCRSNSAFILALRTLHVFFCALCVPVVPCI